MCICPSHVDVLRGPKWQKIAVPCKKCWRCKKNRVEDYVGRALCEAQTSEKVATITLTYAPRDDLADKILHPKHFQLFMKLLRRSGHEVRYLVAGEYGELRGRTHFHAILFFKRLAQVVPSEAPMYNWEHLSDPFASQPFGDQIPHQQNCHIREWPHGHVFVDWSCTPKAIRYVCKYVLADDKNRAWFSLSKKPPLGAAWFAQKAETAKSLDVLPSTFAYAAPGNESNKHPSVMSGATRRDYLNAITQNPEDKPRMSETTLKTFVKYERARLMDDLYSQPAEVQEQAFLDRMEQQEDQAHLMRLGAKFREASENEDALLSSDGVLRLVGGRWTPNKESEP